MTRHIAILTLALTAALSADEAFAAITVNTNVTSRDVEDVILIAVVLINATADEQKLMVDDLYDADPRLADAVLDVADELGAYSQWDRMMIIIAACLPHPKDELGADTDELGMIVIAADGGSEDLDCDGEYSLGQANGKVAPSKYVLGQANGKTQGF